MSATQPSLAAADYNQRHFESLGATIDIRVTAAESNGIYSIIELGLPPHFPGAPLHYHKHLTERFLVLEGELDLQIDGDSQRLSAGDSCQATPGIWHSFKNGTEQPARILIVATPAGHERFFQELMAWMKVEPVWPPADRSKLAEFGAAHDSYYK